MDSIPSCHYIVTNALMDAVMEAINTIVSFVLFKAGLLLWPMPLHALVEVLCFL